LDIIHFIGELSASASADTRGFLQRLMAALRDVDISRLVIRIEQATSASGAVQYVVTISVFASADGSGKTANELAGEIKSNASAENYSVDERSMTVSHLSTRNDDDTTLPPVPTGAASHAAVSVAVAAIAAHL
jgi:hypothetical protein